MGLTQSNPRQGDECPREFDRSDATSGSSTLTDSNVWIAPTDKGSIAEEEDEGDEEDEDEGGEGRGEVGDK